MPASSWRGCPAAKASCPTSAPPGAQAPPELPLPSRGLIGYHGEFLTDTRGTGVMNRLFAGYGPWKGKIEGRRNGALISSEDGEAVQYSLFSLQDRGSLFVSPARRSMLA